MWAGVAHRRVTQNVAHHTLGLSAGGRCQARKQPCRVLTTPTVIEIRFIKFTLTVLTVLII